MNPRLPGLHWQLLAIAGAGLLLLFLLFCAWPGQRPLFLFGLYTVPSHILISPFPHEPVLLWVAKLQPPWAVAMVGTIGACLAGFLDYGLLVPLLSRSSIRLRYERSRFYQKSLRFFRRFPFWFLVVTGFTPIPFFPFKFLSIAGGYPLARYEAALVVGRTPRYYLLAWLGYELRFPDWLLVLLAVLLFLSALGNIGRRFTGAPAADTPPARRPPEPGTGEPQKNPSAQPSPMEKRG